MLKWIFVLAILSAAPVYAKVQEEHHSAGDWEFGIYEGEGGAPGKCSRPVVQRPHPSIWLNRPTSIGTLA